MPADASAQWDTHWNESGPHPDSCIFNGVKFYPGDEVCIAPGRSQACEPDGTLSITSPAPDCKSAEQASPQITKDGGRGDQACLFDGKKFSVGGRVMPKLPHGLWVHLTVQRRSGKTWKGYKTYLVASPDYYTYSYFTKRLQLPKGAYRVRAWIPGDAYRFAGTTAYGSVTVR